MQAGAALGEELARPACRRASGREQLDVVLADVEQHGLDALLGHGLAVDERHAVGLPRAARSAASRSATAMPMWSIRWNTGPQGTLRARACRAGRQPGLGRRARSRAARRGACAGAAPTCALLCSRGRPELARAAGRRAGAARRRRRRRHRRPGGRARRPARRPARASSRRAPRTTSCAPSELPLDPSTAARARRDRDASCAASSSAGSPTGARSSTSRAPASRPSPRAAPTPLKPRLGPLAYAVGAARAAVDGVAAALHRPGRRRQPVFEGAAWQVIVAVTGAFGGGSGVGAADPSDGVLDVDDPPRRLARRARPPRLGAQAPHDRRAARRRAPPRRT